MLQLLLYYYRCYTTIVVILLLLLYYYCCHTTIVVLLLDYIVIGQARGILLFLDYIIIHIGLYWTKDYAKMPSVVSQVATHVSLNGSVVWRSDGRIAVMNPKTHLLYQWGNRKEKGNLCLGKGTVAQLARGAVYGAIGGLRTDIMGADKGVLGFH
jgi:hypothetical protein